MGCTESYEGKGDGYTIRINSIIPSTAKDKGKLWYFVVSDLHSVFAYNSTLDGTMYETKESCFSAAKEKAVELKREGFPEKKDNVHQKRVSFFD